MKRTVLVFGLIAGGLSALMMAGTLPLVDRIGFDKGEVVGYTSMVLAGLLIFFGIRSYRENVGGGTMTFGILETTFTNQRGESVLISRSTLVETAAPVKKE